MLKRDIVERRHREVHMGKCHIEVDISLDALSLDNLMHECAFGVLSESMS